ncbi:hypothetical protein RhiJN_19660 [Ceratobasidium sp. AG-Ba]|nr:hypothetical protein RhiJN_19660 [Ceratobasidium sp. AG-Ba]
MPVVSDDDKDLPADHDLSVLQQELNSIRLLFQWGKEDAKTRPQTKFPLPREHGRLHERAVKKGHESCNAELGNTISTTGGRQMLYDFRPVLPLKPLMFIFRYSPEDWLRAKEIIPPRRTPSQKRRRDSPVEIIDVDAREYINVDDLESEDDEVQIMKYMIPLTPPPSKKRQRIKAEFK